MSYAGGILFSAVVYFGFGIYNYLVVPFLGDHVFLKRLEYRAPVHRKLDTADHITIVLAKLITIMFVYHCVMFAMNTEVSGMVCNLDVGDMMRALAMSPIHFLFLFVIYDFFYTLFHWALHWPPIYPLIHKHHHKQMSPYRGNDDAINTHPLEYISGEYLHLGAFYLLTKIFGPGIHALTLLLFIFVGGTLASLNHTRVDMRIPYMFNVWAHDYHHRQPRCNYGQYIMLWDAVFGTFKPAHDMPDMCGGDAAAPVKSTPKRKSAAK